MSANIEQIKAMLERTGKTNLSQKQKVDLDKERLQLEATVNIENTDKGLEEEIQRYLREECSGDDEPSISEIARHFAEWQAEADKETIKLAEDHAYLAGANWQKKQMLKDAVEGEVCILPGSVAYVDERDNNALIQYIIDNFKAGDKVKIIIVKKD